jgi:hypothetical protein
MKPEELAYMAGFIDGEGAFLINRRIHRSKDKQLEWLGYSAYIDIGNNNKEVMDWMKQVVNNSSAVYYYHPSKGKMSYRMRIPGKLAMRLTTELLPYLIVKKEAAKVFLKFPLLHKKDMQDVSAKVFEEMRAIHLTNGKSHPILDFSNFPSVETGHELSPAGDKGTVRHYTKV